MKRLLILLLLAVAISSCADPTRIITNKPKSEGQKQKEREQRRQEDKAATEALKNFRITDHAGRKTRPASPKEDPQRSSKGSHSKPAENGKQTSSAPETPSTQPEMK